MADQYMYTKSRYITNNPLQNRTQYAFEVATSAIHRQYHQMRTQMTSDVLQLFKANQIGFLRAPIKKKCRPIDPITTLGMNLTQMFAIPNLQMIQQQKKQTKLQRKQRIAKQKSYKNLQVIQQNMKYWNPFKIPQSTNNPQKTLFVSRLNYKTNQKQLKHQFQRYGSVKNIHIIRDQQGYSKGYAFIQFQNKQDFNHAYKNANQRKIAGRRVIVDFQRGRTILKWRPRRLGGGLGNLRMTKQQTKRLQQQQKFKAGKKTQRESRSRQRSREKRQRRRDDDRDRQHRRKQKKDKRDKRDKKQKRQRSR